MTWAASWRSIWLSTLLLPGIPRDPRELLEMSVIPWNTASRLHHRKWSYFVQPCSSSCIFIQQFHVEVQDSSCQTYPLPLAKGQANNTRLLKWVTRNQQNRCKGYILRDLSCPCSSPIAFTHSPFWKLYKTSAVTVQLAKLCFPSCSCYLWTAGSVKLPINSLQSDLPNLKRVRVILMARYNGLTDQ